MASTPSKNVTLSSCSAKRTRSDDSAVRLSGLSKAVLGVAPYREFFMHYNGKKVPAETAFSEFLVKTAKVPAEWAADCMKHILTDARYVGFLISRKNSEYVDLQGTALATAGGPLDADDPGDNEAPERLPGTGQAAAALPASDGQRDEAARIAGPAKPRKVFVAHGKNHKPLEQLKAMLTELGVPHAVAVDGAHAGRPVSEKVASMMRDDCSSAICVFSADERFLREGPDGETVEVWRPSENAVYELGAASVLYGRKVILFKEDKVSLPSDFSDIGHITFKGDQIDSHLRELLRELKAHGIINVIVAG